MSSSLIIPALHSEIFPVASGPLGFYDVLLLLCGGHWLNTQLAILQGRWQRDQPTEALELRCWVHRSGTW